MLLNHNSDTVVCSNVSVVSGFLNKDSSNKATLKFLCWEILSKISVLLGYGLMRSDNPCVPGVAVDYTTPTVTDNLHS